MLAAKIRAVERAQMAGDRAADIDAVRHAEAGHAAGLCGQSGGDQFRAD
jgi:phosphoglycolate phosphatase-like HAD superfamily hydrolase